MRRIRRTIEKAIMKSYKKLIFLDYPVNLLSRYGHGKQPHQALHKILDRNREAYVETFRKMEECKEELSKVATEYGGQEDEPFWNNGYVEELDAATLFTFTYIYQPQTYLEVGSGNSTKFVRKAIQQYSLNTRIISIDPSPRAEINNICDAIIRKPLEDIDLGIFSDLGENDILMIDGSHRCFQNSDVTITFLEVLPKLKSGVIVYIDDIFLPYDYPPELKYRFYSEQYLLAVLLLNDQNRYTVLFPCTFIANDEEFSDIVQSFWSGIGDRGVRGCGNGLWLRVN